MFINYIKIAFRNLVKHKTYSFINLIGLTIGITCLGLIISYVQYELSYDEFNMNADNIYRVTSDEWVPTPVPLNDAIKEFFPEAVNTVRIKKENKILISEGNRNFYENNIIFADPTIFDIFTFPMLIGNSQTALIDPYSVVITEEIAQRYFGDQNPIGKRLKYNDRFDFTITGVLKNIPNNSHLKFDFAFSLNCAKSVFYADFFENRMNTTVYNYLQLDSRSNFEQVKARMDDFTKYYLGEDFYNSTRDGQWKINYHIQPLKDIHLYSDLGNELEANGDINNVYIFSAIAILILLIACINYVNLTMARYISRVKEIGIRKIVGANRGQIIYQLVAESIILSLLAIFVVTILFQIALPFLNSFPELKGAFTGNSFSFLLSLLIIAIFTGLISGFFPSLFLSRFQPLSLLSKKILRRKKNLSFANLLIVFQFVISTVLIIATLVINNQLSYLQNKKLGFNKEQVVIVPMQDAEIVKKHEILKKDLLQQRGIVSVSASQNIPGTFIWVRSFGWEGKDPDEDNTVKYIKTDEDFLKTYKIKLVEGRGFSEEQSTDTSLGFIINKAAIAKFGWETPIGKRIETFGKSGSVIGVVDNFNFESLHKTIEPLVLYHDASNFEYLSIRIKTDNVASILNTIENRWEAFFPGKPYKYYFMDEHWENLYRKEQNMKNLFSSFTGLAIFIACLGLFGLAAFSAKNKTKEIGIRKVLGASVPSVLIMLANEFLKWVIISFVFAFPIAYYIMNNWLEDFAYRIDMSWWMFAVSGGIALLIALITVSSQAIKAATTNPVESLRNE